MSTKLNPGAYDCYARLADDEPYFVLRAKDPQAPALIEQWADERQARYGAYPKLDEARACAREMRAWKSAHPEAMPSVPVHVSVQPCGCDPGAGWICEQHRQKDVQPVYVEPRVIVSPFKLP